MQYYNSIPKGVIRWGCNTIHALVPSSNHYIMYKSNVKIVATENNQMCIPEKAAEEAENFRFLLYSLII